MEVTVRCKGADAWPIDKFIEFQGDLKSLAKEDYEKLKAQLTDPEIGFCEPITVWPDQNLIANGHQRIRTLSMMARDGFTVPKIPVSFVYPKDKESFAKIVLSLCSQYGAIDKQGMYEYCATHDIPVTYLEERLRLPELDIPKYKAEYTEEPSDCSDDEIPEVKDDPLVWPGDLFALGSHRLLCGDATKTEDVTRLMNGEKAEMVYTDPPYGMNLDAEAFGHKNVHGDNAQFDPKPMLNFFDFVEDVFIWGADYFVELLGRSWPDLGSWIIWDKCKEIGMETDWSGRHGSEFETLWSKKKYQRKIIRAVPRIGFFAKKDEERVHPTQKPVKLHELFFEQYGKDKTNIVDLYLGSGSTLIACEKTNRRCFGTEIDPHYCQVIIERYLKFTGRDDVFLETKEGLQKWEDLKKERSKNNVETA